MKKTTHEFFCDHCGKEIFKQHHYLTIRDGEFKGQKKKEWTAGAFSSALLDVPKRLDIHAGCIAPYFQALE